MALSTRILRRVRGHGRGHVFTAADFLDLAGRNSVDQALVRLARRGKIRRIDRGVYDLPKVHPKAGVLWPSADTVARAIARQTDSQIKVAGPHAANILGLTTQVPARPTYLTDGRSRTVQVGRLRVALRHANRQDMLLADSKAGLAIVALRYLGRAAATPDVLDQLSSTLGDDDKARLLGVRRKIGGWLGTAVEQVARS